MENFKFLDLSCLFCALVITVIGIFMVPLQVPRSTLWALRREAPHCILMVRPAALSVVRDSMSNGPQAGSDHSAASLALCEAHPKDLKQDQAKDVLSKARSPLTLRVPQVKGGASEEWSSGA